MVTTWLLLALLLFWAVGAYNRLIRLRSAALQTFGGLDTYMVRLIALMGEYQAARGAVEGPRAPGADTHAALGAATTQFGASLAVARARPLDAEAAAALSAGVHVLEAAWQAVVREAAAPDVPDALAPWIRQREQLALQSATALEQFNTAVAQYNQGIAQFPASLLAWLFGFKKAQPL